jgi:hypothetical protein
VYVGFSEANVGCKSIIVSDGVQRQYIVSEGWESMRKIWKEACMIHTAAER